MSEHEGKRAAKCNLLASMEPYLIGLVLRAIVYLVPDSHAAVFDPRGGTEQS